MAIHKFKKRNKRTKEKYCKMCGLIVKIGEKGENISCGKS